MLRIIVAGLRAHPLRYVLTGIVVVLSVGFTAGTLVLTDSLDRAATTSGAPAAGHMRVPLLVLGAVSLIVAAFVIANTFRILVAQRSKELALLRTVGATRRQVIVGVLSEAAVTGVAGGVAGTGLGIIGGYVIAAQIAADTVELPLVVAASSVIWPVVVGLLVTIGSAAIPVRAATRVSPLAAARAVPDGDDTTSVRRVRGRAGVLLVVFGTATMLLGAVAPVGTLGLVVVVFGAALCFLGILVLGPAIVPPLLRMVGVLVASVRGSQRSTVDLATATAVHSPRRAAATSAALLIGVTVVTGFVTVGESVRDSVGVILDRQIPADYVVTTDDAGAKPGSVPAHAIEMIESLPEMGDSASLYRTTVDSELGRVELTGIDLAAYGRLARMDGSGSLSDHAAGGVALDHATASRHGLGVGDDVVVAGATLRVSYVLGETNSPFEGLTVAPDVYRGLVPDTAGPQQFAVDAADGVPTPEAEAAIDSVLAAMPELSVYRNLRSKEEINEQFDQAVAVVVAILGLAVVIAAIGMANTLSLAVHERTREIGLLRALGMTGRGVRAMLGVEAVLSSVVAAGMGVVVGVAFSLAAVRSIPNLVFVVPWSQVALCLLAAAGLGLLASVAPARRAARVSPVVALATE